MEIQKRRRKEETEKRRSLARESRESFSQILLRRLHVRAVAVGAQNSEKRRPFTWPAARRRVLRSRGNEKTGGTLETQTETDLPPDISEWNSMTGIESFKCLHEREIRTSFKCLLEVGITEDQDVLRVLLLRGKFTPHSTRHLQRSARLCSAISQSVQLARSLSLSLALLGLLARALRDARRATPRRERTRWIYTCTRDIIAASSRHAALVRNGSPRALLPSSCSRRRERKKRDGS
ncbi:PREDICTED: uncharacterized protein LOC108749737 [Trachymyrmex septentrionalis]|uniref:uncharacterized protein LOC108749737 n=1 Tax=Trachymyrmex septentrionalis TaxID=34720 RepID=UPI00084EE9BC|nr:PREDICTED: uncharacterized protein LOC108749737 [Trachymyrmex septentrionalis]